MPDTPIPNDWKSFLSVDDNKQNLFQFLAPCLLELVNVAEAKSLYVTQGSEVLCKPCDTDVSNISPCNAEEADQRIVLHCRHSYSLGSRRFLIHVSDTDVVVLCVAFATDYPNTKIWIRFGTGRNCRYVCAHGIARKMMIINLHMAFSSFMSLQVATLFQHS